MEDRREIVVKVGIAKVLVNMASRKRKANECIMLQKGSEQRETKGKVSDGIRRKYVFHENGSRQYYISVLRSEF